jgi:UDP-glucose 4-epimerase
MSSSSVIVTGAAGFIGSYIVDRLLAQGMCVVGIDNFVLGRRENIREAIGNNKFTLLEVDLSDYAAAHRAITLSCERSPANFVWHMAANSDISAGIQDPDVDLRNTFMTTFNVLSIMRELDIRQIAFASSSAIYGVHPGILTEDMGPLFPISNYGAMKLASEAIISAAVETFLANAWIFRFPNVIGRRATHGVIYDFIRKLKNDPSYLEVLGDGGQQKAYLHVVELLDAMFYAIKRSEDKLNYFNVGNSDTGATVRFIATSVVSAVAPSAEIRYKGGTKGWVGDVPSFRYSIEKLAKLGWVPRISSEEAVLRSVREQLEE